MVMRVFVAGGTGGPWFPEPLLTDPYQDPERSAELADGGATRGERPARRDLPRPGQQGALYLGARRTRRADPDDPLGEQPRQARARGSGGGRLGGRPRGEPGSPEMSGLGRR